MSKQGLSIGELKNELRKCGVTENVIATCIERKDLESLLDQQERKKASAVDSDTKERTEAEEFAMVQTLQAAFFPGEDPNIRIERMNVLMRRVKSKFVKRDIKKTLAAQFTKLAIDEVTTALPEESETNYEAALEITTKLERIATNCSVAIHYHRKAPEALGARGWSALMRQQHGPALKDLAAAVSYKDELHLWKEPRMADTYQIVLRNNKDLFRFGEWVKLSGPCPSPRFFTTFCHDTEKMYMLGGHLPEPGYVIGTQIPELWVLDMRTEPFLWTELEISGTEGVFPVERAGMIHHNGVLYVYGGKRHAHTTETFFSIDLSSRQLKVLRASGEGPGVRGEPATFLHGGDLVIVGGGFRKDMDIWRCSLSELKWSKQRTHYTKNPDSRIPSEFQIPPPFADWVGFSWWWDAPSETLRVWAKESKTLTYPAWWECNIKTCEWRRTPFDGFSAPAACHRACCSTPSGAHWGFGGQTEGFREIVVTSDEDGIATPRYLGLSYNDEVVWCKGKRWKIVLPASNGPTPDRRAAAAIAPLPREQGEGFVMFGGWTAYNMDETDIDEPRPFGDTWLFRLHDAPAPTRPGPAAQASAGGAAPHGSSGEQQRQAGAAPEEEEEEEEEEFDDSPKPVMGPQVKVDRCQGPNCRTIGVRNKEFFAAIEAKEGEKQVDKLLRCARCRQVSYCSKACQIAHWPAHKTECKRLAEAAAQHQRPEWQDSLRAFAKGTPRR